MLETKLIAESLNGHKRLTYPGKSLVLGDASVRKENA